MTAAAPAAPQGINHDAQVAGNRKVASAPNPVVHWALGTVDVLNNRSRMAAEGRRGVQEAKLLAVVSRSSWGGVFIETFSFWMV